MKKIVCSFLLFDAIWLAKLSQGSEKAGGLMYTDMVRYTALTQISESRAIGVLDKHNRNSIDKKD